jgi:ATP-dependent protease ClpP protease subunit
MVLRTVIGHIYIYGEVGKQVTLDTVLKEITPKNSAYIVHIHSNGGDVFEGYAIYNAIKNTGKNITVHIEGVCASIATLIAAAGSKIIMNTKSQFMIHNPRISSMGGDAKDLRNVAGQLDKIKSQLIDSWIGRTSLSMEQLSDMYDHETWLSPEQAKDMGFVDEVQEVLKAVASADLKKYHGAIALKPGDTVKVKAGMEHSPDMKGMSFKVSEISSEPAIALEMPDGSMHKWYVESELQKDNMTMDNKQSALNKIMNMISQLFSPENRTETLSDGRIIVTPEEGDWTGQPITLEDGTPLEDGSYTLASGRTITVAGGAITEVIEPEAKTEEKTEEEKPEDMELKEKLATAEARIKELESAIEASTKTATQAEAKAKSFENKLNTEVKAVKDELEKLKNTTAGDATPPKKAEKVITNNAVPTDGFQAWAKKNLFDTRNTD